MAQILCFGDSITQGYTDISGGWTQHLRKALDLKYRTEQDNPAQDIFNLGISGDTSDELLSRIESDIVARRLGEKQIIVIAIGTNDSVFQKSTNEFYKSNEDFYKNLEDIYKIASKYSENIIFIGLTPADELKVSPMPWSSKGKCYSNERLKIFNNTLKDFTDQKNLAFVGLFDDFMAMSVEEYNHDGIHLTPNGHKIIAQKLLPIIEEKL